jgi:hypothetical protein
MIIIEPFGGMANRMRFIASGVWLKEKLADELVVIWNEDADLTCPYHLLFEQQDSFVVRNKRRSDIFIHSLNQPAGLNNFQIYIRNKTLSYNHCLSFKDVSQLLSHAAFEGHEIPEVSRDVYIRSGLEFGDTFHTLKKFQPISELKRKINDIVKCFDAYTIGVHIRRTDHHWSIDNSPVEKFIEKMWEEIAANSRVSFFLCTDDALVENQLKKEFNNRVFCYEKELSRRTVNGMQDALVEMYCLSNTSKILGSYWSSFSETSAQINDVQLITILKDQDITSR